MRRLPAMAALVLALAGAFFLAETAGAADPAPPESFAQLSLKSGRIQASLARLAAERAADADVRRFAAALVRDIDARNERLAALLHAIGAREVMDIGTDFSAEELAERTREFYRLRARDGFALDKQFLRAVIIGYDNALRGYQAAAQSYDDEVKQLVSESLPRMKADLAEARRLLERMEKRER